MTSSQSATKKPENGTRLVSDKLANAAVGMFVTGLLAVISTVMMAWRGLAVFETELLSVKELTQTELGAIRRDVGDIKQWMRDHLTTFERHSESFHAHEKDLGHPGISAAFQEQQRLLLQMNSHLQSMDRKIKNGN